MSRITLLPLILIFLAATTYSWSKPCIDHPAEPTALLLGSFIATAELGGTESNGRDLYLPGGSCRTQFEVCVWSTTGGGISYVVRVASIGFSGSDATDIDPIATPSICDAIAFEAVRQGRGLGYGNTSSSCTSTEPTRVYMEGCVQRSGSGSGTLFTVCDQEIWSARSFLVCTPSGADPTITRIAPASYNPATACPADCETTWEY